MWKFVIIIISLISLLIGLFYHHDLLLVGAILYVIVLLIDFISIIVLSLRSKKNINNEIPIKIEKSAIKTISSYFEGVILIIGLILSLSDGAPLKTSGLIIWVGSIAIYFIGGIVIREIVGIPLTFGYGGWKISNKYNRK